MIYGFRTERTHSCVVSLRGLRTSGVCLLLEVQDGPDKDEADRAPLGQLVEGWEYDHDPATGVVQLSDEKAAKQGEDFNKYQ